jgi:hypothetical protein
MIKPYHLTQEQADNLAYELFGDYCGDVLSEKHGAISELINAVLDEVLGEPVAYRWYESKWSEYRYTVKPNKHRTCTPLYAPRREK